MTGVFKITFKGEKYLLIGDLTDGAITTEEQYGNFWCSYAHVFPDGKVRRFLKVIGTKDDIEVLGKHPSRER